MKANLLYDSNVAARVRPRAGGICEINFPGLSFARPPPAGRPAGGMMHPGPAGAATKFQKSRNMEWNKSTRPASNMINLMTSNFPCAHAPIPPGYIHMCCEHFVVFASLAISISRSRAGPGGFRVPIRPNNAGQYIAKSHKLLQASCALWIDILLDICITSSRKQLAPAAAMMMPGGFDDGTTSLTGHNNFDRSSRRVRTRAQLKGSNRMSHTIDTRPYMTCIFMYLFLSMRTRHNG